MQQNTLSAGRGRTFLLPTARVALIIAGVGPEEASQGCIGIPPGHAPAALHTQGSGRGGDLLGITGCFVKGYVTQSARENITSMKCFRTHVENGSSMP
jgi:hypothetical protein